MDKPRISVIIPAYNEEKYIGKTLEHVETTIKACKVDGKVEVIVVNNDSSDNTEEIAKGYGAKVIFEKENCIAKAKNRGASYGEGKYLIFLDADTLINEKIINKIDKVLSSGKVIGGGAFVDYDKYWDVRFTAKIINYLCLLFKVASGAFLFCDRESFDRVGGFDESLYGLEELVFAKALKKEGKRRNKKFVIISDCSVVSSSRRVDYSSRWKIIKAGLSLLWNRDKKIRDKKFCEKIWYDVKK